MNKTLKELLLGDEPTMTEGIRLSEDSVDAQIDSILIGYQGDTLQQHEALDGKLNKYFRLLLEAPPEDEEDEDLDLDDLGDEEGDVDAPEDEEGGGMEMDPGQPAASDQTIGDDEMAADEPATPKVDKIDIDEFAQKVYNLLTNYQNLLNIEPVLINRAKKVLTENGYDQNTLNEFEEILEIQFGVSLDGERDEMPERPFGGSAGPIS